MKKGLLALSPLALFVLLYLVTSIIARDFYKVPILVAFMATSVYAIALTCGPLQRRRRTRVTLRQCIDVYSRGAATGQMMLMIWIFILAGAFAHTAKVMGAIDATVQLALTLLPGQMLLAGLFLAACFISLSVGTSVGTIVALTPIAAGMASQTGASVPLMVAVVVGGSFFGDNLSFISDTTIAATSTQGCRLSDKFRVNAFIVVPAAAVILAIYLVMGRGMASPQPESDIAYMKVAPYLVVLVAAVMGMNVLGVLTIGTILAGLIGIGQGAFDIFGWLEAVQQGVLGMGELILITMMAGGLLEVIKHNGGITYIIRLLTRHVHTRRGAELAIAALVSVVDCCTANNTVAIITVGGIAKQIADRFGVDPRKCASILDTFSCCTQGLLPYGAQILMASGLAALNPVSLMPYLYYPVAIGIAALAAILLNYPKRFS